MGIIFSIKMGKFRTRGVDARVKRAVGWFVVVAFFVIVWMVVTVCTFDTFWENGMDIANPHSVVTNRDFHVIEHDVKRTPLKEGKEELVIKILNDQYGNIIKMTRGDNSPILTPVSHQNNGYDKILVQERIAQEVGKILDQNNVIFQKDISVKFIEKLPDVDTQLPAQDKTVCDDEHLLLFIKGHYYNSLKIPFNQRKQWDLEETEQKLASDISSHFYRTLFVFIFIPIFFMTWWYLLNNEGDIYERELIRIYSTYGTSQKAIKRFRKERYKSTPPLIQPDSLIQTLMNEGDIEISPVIKDIIARYRANIIQDLNDAQSLLVRLILKTFYLMIGVYLVRDSSNSSFLKHDDNIFKNLTSKLNDTTQNQTFHNLSSKVSQNSDHLCSNDEATSAGNSFIESVPTHPSCTQKKRKNRH